MLHGLGDVLFFHGEHSYITWQKPWVQEKLIGATTDNCRSPGHVFSFPQIASEGRMASRNKPAFALISYPLQEFVSIECQAILCCTGQSKMVAPECNFRLSVNRNSFCGLNLKQPCKGLFTDYYTSFLRRG